jgi:hypothetical protein
MFFLDLPKPGDVVQPSASRTKDTKGGYPDASRISPVPPFIAMMDPSAMSCTAFASDIAGIPYSREQHEKCAVTPPVWAITPLATPKTDVQPGDLGPGECPRLRALEQPGELPEGEEVEIVLGFQKALLHRSPAELTKQQFLPIGIRIPHQRS